jgi:hypothetical protein
LHGETNTRHLLSVLDIARRLGISYGCVWVHCAVYIEPGGNGVRYRIGMSGVRK